MLYEVMAFIGTLLLIAYLRGRAPRFGLVDKPSPRKRHLGEVPLIGGLAIAGAFLGTALIHNIHSPFILPFYVACAVVLVTGLLDDLSEFSAKSKFIGQLTAALLMTSWADLFLVDLGNLWGTGDVVLNNWAIPFTVFCVIGIMNAMNMIDGLDGFAGGVAAIAAFWLCLAGGFRDSLYDPQLLCILVAATGAFLVFNLRHPWRSQAVVFLGDAGSMFLGFVLVWFAVDITQNPPRFFYAISAVWILGVPIMDTVYVLLRRMIRGQSPFSPDRRHVHHTLMYIGLNEAQTCWVLLGVSVLFGAVGFFGWFYGVPEYFLAYGFVSTFAVHCVFMHYWREILRFFGVNNRKLVVERVAEVKAMAE